jgi:hypothetical protein
MILNHKMMPKEHLSRGIIEMPTQRLNDQRTDEGQAGSGVEQKARGDPEKQGMLLLDAFNGHLTPQIKPTITGSSLNRNPGFIPGE